MILRLSKRGKPWRQVKSSKAIWTTKAIIRLNNKAENNKAGNIHLCQISGYFNKIYVSVGRVLVSSECSNDYSQIWRKGEKKDLRDHGLSQKSTLLLYYFEGFFFFLNWCLFFLLYFLPLVS